MVRIDKKLKPLTKAQKLIIKRNSIIYKLKREKTQLELICNEGGITLSELSNLNEALESLELIIINWGNRTREITKKEKKL